jgi:KDO2-lipid IV(A) lauroyltransferase
MLKKITDQFTQGSLGTVIAMKLSQSVPSSVGYPIAAAIASAIASRWWNPVVQAVKQNQTVIHDFKLNRKELYRAVRHVFIGQSRSLYNFYHYLDRLDRIKELVKISPRMQAMMESCNKGGQGTFMLIPHLSGFDLGGLLLASMGFKFLTLSYPNPPKGYEMQNKLRTDRGEELMPMSFESIQEARERLQAGGTVLTGIDRPHPGSGYHPLFFDHPAELPVAYIKLALKTNARVHVIGFQTLPNMTYEIDASDEVILQHMNDPKEELENNAARVLKVAEGYILKNPASWAMFYPVWPQLEDKTN